MRAYRLALLVIVGTLAAAASSPAQPAKVVATAAASKKALEERFLKLQETSTVKLVRVSSTTTKAGETVLAIELRPPTPEKFEFHAETAMTLAWQALFKVPGAFEQVARLQLTLSNARTMAIDCSMKTVQESYGYFDFAGIKKGCTVR